MTQTASQSQSIAQAPISFLDAERQRQMRDSWKAYKGDFPPPLKISANEPDDNVISNRCAPIVNKGVSFLFGQTLKIECVDETSEPDTENQAFTDGVWGDDDTRMTTLSHAGINGGVCGQIFLRLLPPRGEMKFPRIVVIDPLIVRMVTPVDDCMTVLAYIIEYPSGNGMQTRQVIARVDPDGLASVAGESDLDDTWTITNYTRRGQSGSWYQIGEREYWPYPFAPIFTRQNLPNPNETWGFPDLTPDLINQNKVLNFVQSNTSRILKFHAHPKTWGKGFRAEQMNVGVDDVMIIESSDGTLQTLEMQSDLASSLNFAAIIRTDMDEQSRVPAVSLGRLSDIPRGNVSGVALQLLFQPLIEKTIQKQRLYGALIRDITRAALVMGGKLSLEEYADYPIELHWQSLLPIDDLQAAQTAVILQGLGISQSTLLAGLGYDAVDEAEKRQTEMAHMAQPSISLQGNGDQQGMHQGGIDE